MINDQMLEYLLITTLVNTFVLGMASGMLGVFISTQKAYTSINTASAAAFTGILLSVVITGTKSGWLISISAAIFCAVSFLFISTVLKTIKINKFVLTSVIISILFGLCISMFSFLRNNNITLANNLSEYLFGKTFFILKNETGITFYTCIFSVILLTVCMKNFKAAFFSEEMARTSKIRVTFFKGIFFITTSFVVATGIQFMGVLFLSSLFIFPVISARLQTKLFVSTVFLSGLIGGISIAIGGLVSSCTGNMPTGATTTLILMFLLIISLLFSSKKTQGKIV